MSRKALDLGGPTGRVRSKRHSRSRSVEEAQMPVVFNVIGKGLFELEDFHEDDDHALAQMQMEMQIQSREVGHIETKRAECPCKCQHADKRESVSVARESKVAKAQAQDMTDMEMMAERFAKLLLGEDMSGGKKGVSSALALSNAITNLSASIFGELWRLEPLPPERNERWRKEIGWFLSVVDHIVEFVPSYQSSLDGSIIEVMVTKPRSDLQMNIPALRKLEAMLFECMDRFVDTEFWYVGRGMAESNSAYSDDSDNINNPNPRQTDKWWIPSPKIPDGGLSDDTRKSLQHQRDSVNQILKAALAINSQVLSEMEIPDIYWESFPKNGKAILGDVIYRHITSEHFCPDVLLCTLDLSTDHRILDVKNRIEAAVVLWRKKMRSSKSSWGTFNDEKRELHAERAETLLTLLKLKFPGLPQSVLDITKIQYNRDVGQSVLESYSRVLESLAFNILSRMDDVLHADDMVKRHKALFIFSRSTSTDSLFADSFAPPSPLPTPRSMACMYPTPLRGSPTHHHHHHHYHHNHNHMRVAEATQSDDDEEEEPPYICPSAKTLSEFISWEDEEKEKEHGMQQGLGPPTPTPSPMAVKKLSPVRVASNLRRYYWSYIESLEKMGVAHSPPSRD